MSLSFKQFPRLVLAGLLVASLAVPASAAPQTTALTRYAGSNQIETAIAISQNSYQDKSVDRVILARSNYFADAIAATPLAVKVNSPILLTETDTLNLKVFKEIQRILRPGGYVTIIGGEQALSAQVDYTIKKMGINTERLAGRNRWETNQVILSTLGKVENLALVSGQNDNMADALLAAVNISRAGTGAIAYTDGKGGLPTVTSNFIAQNKPSLIYSYDIATNVSTAIVIGGANTTERSINTANLAYVPEGINYLGFASADSNNLADALAAAPMLARLGAPIIMLDAANSAQVATYLATTTAKVTSGGVFGGPAAVQPAWLDGAFLGHTKTETTITPKP